MGHFGVDTNNLQPGDNPERLWHLLRRLDRIPGDWRMRLSSIETVEVNDDFIKAAGDCEHLCPQFHPALQSGSNSVLTRMRRRYRVERFLERLDQIRETLGNDPAFSTDVIVGFPGETDGEFEETLDTCRKARFMKVHVFPFSRRDGTPAATMPDQIHPEVIKERVRILSDLERGLAEQFYLSRVNGCFGSSTDEPGSREMKTDKRLLEVLAERESETRPGYVRGTDRWYMPVEVPGNVADLGHFVQARAASANREGVVAERVSEMRDINSAIQPGRSVLQATEIESLDSTDNFSSACDAVPAEMIQLGIPQLNAMNSGADSWPR